ncbi:MAG: nucleotidyltransferase domain-containing protein [Chloroflexota bacterium]|nr:nucleotidyltransferase domain-containing protein [Chloroflexota bacterium]
MAVLFRTEPMQRIIGLLYLSPDREMGLSEIAASLEDVAARRTVIYALDQLVSEGYVEKLHADTPRPTYRADRANYLFDELRSVSLKTLGGFSALSDALATDPNVLAAAVYGSFAKATARATSDIDLLLVVDDPTAPAMDDLTRAMDEAAASLGRHLNVRSYGANEFRQKRSAPFLSRVLAEPIVVLKGKL